MSESTRRGFLATSAGALAGSLALAPQVYAGGDDRLRVGLIGCGGRGSGAAAQALRADKNVALFAMGDAFADRIESSLAALRDEADVAPKLDVPPERRFTGFNAYQQVIDCCDVVLLCTPPQFRPLHLKAAIEAGRHVFAEKPVAVDAPGVRSVLATIEQAREKKLSVVSGLCLRYDNGFRETVRRIHDGAVGEILTLEANDYRSSIWVKPREADWTDMVWQMRNWYYFTWLSGDFNVEQHVHYLDTCAWLLGNEYPVQAIGMGGRQVRNEPQFGHIFDHFSVVYEFASGATLYSQCRQQPGCARDMSVKITGSKGRGLLTENQRGQSITSDQSRWVFSGPPNQMYQTEHDVLFAGIRSGNPVNNGLYMAQSTLLAIMGRMAAYTGQRITWEMALHSQEDLSPPAYDWNVPLAVPAVAQPGVTRFH